MWTRSLLAAGAIVGVMCAVALAESPGAGQATGEDPSLVAKTSLDSATLARRGLMDAIGGDSDALKDMANGILPWDDATVYRTLQTMSAMLEAFPQLFRVQPNPWTQEAEDADPVHVSLALSDAWENWDTFQALNAQAAATARRAATSARKEASAIILNDLQAQCDSCHASFRRSFDNFDDFGGLPPASAQPSQ